MNELLKFFGFLTILFVICNSSSDLHSVLKPNIVILLADDLGYGDLSVYGHPSQEFGPIDQMAAEGLRFTNFYAADSLCTPARAGLLTGRLPIRLGLFGRPKRCLHPPDRGGLPRNETTLPEYLEAAGYRTGMVGKWHLGINAFNASDGTHLPTHRFHYVGTNIPYTINWDCDDSKVFAKNGPSVHNCFLYQGNRIVQQPIRFENLTSRMVQEFKTFVESSEEQAFFFYFSFPQVHVNLFASSRFRGMSNRGMFGDNLNEMAWAIGEVLGHLKEKNLARETLVLFLSDHGPHEELCQLGGLSGPFKGGKSHSWEGGFRVPAIAWWPGVVRTGTSTEVISSLDLVPSFLRLAGVDGPADRILDGQDSSSLLLGAAASPNNTRILFFYCNEKLMAVRFGDFKIHFNIVPLKSIDRTMQCPGGIHIQNWYLLSRCPDSEVVAVDPPLVYHLGRDPGERDPLPVAKVQDILTQVRLRVDEHSRRMQPGQSQHGSQDSALVPCCDPPNCRCDYQHDLKHVEL